MKTPTSVCLVLLLSCLTELVKSQSLLLNSCSVTVHMQELRKYYSSLRLDAITGDNEIGVKFLDKSLIKEVQDGQTCCFLHLVLRFYVERVFGNYVSSQPQNQRSSSSLANAFVSIRRDIHKCHCLCSEETQKRVDSLHAAFGELEVNKAAQKAVGELDTVLEWLDGQSQKASR